MWRATVSWVSPVWLGPATRATFALSFCACIVVFFAPCCSPAWRSWGGAPGAGLRSAPSSYFYARALSHRYDVLHHHNLPRLVLHPAARHRECVQGDSDGDVDAVMDPPEREPDDAVAILRGAMPPRGYSRLTAIVTLMWPASAIRFLRNVLVIYGHNIYEFRALLTKSAAHVLGSRRIIVQKANLIVADGDGAAPTHPAAQRRPKVQLSAPPRPRRLLSPPARHNFLRLGPRDRGRTPHKAMPPSRSVFVGSMGSAVGAGRGSRAGAPPPQQGSRGGPAAPKAPVWRPKAAQPGKVAGGDVAHQAKSSPPGPPTTRRRYRCAH